MREQRRNQAFTRRRLASQGVDISKLYSTRKTDLKEEMIKREQRRSKAALKHVHDEQYQKKKKKNIAAFGSTYSPPRQRPIKKLSASNTSLHVVKDVPNSGNKDDDTSSGKKKRVLKKRSTWFGKKQNSTVDEKVKADQDLHASNSAPNLSINQRSSNNSKRYNKVVEKEKKVKYADRKKLEDMKLKEQKIKRDQAFENKTIASRKRLANMHKQKQVAKDEAKRKKQGQQQQQQQQQREKVVTKKRTSSKKKKKKR